MAFFVGLGTISDEIVRKETRNGVLATFRLAAGAPNDRRLWIDIEAWGQLAGTVAHHGSKGRSVLVSGRLNYKTWRDRSTGESRHRHVVTALDVDLLSEMPNSMSVPTTLVASGAIETLRPSRPTRRGIVHAFRLASGRAGSKTGRLWIEVEHWLPSGSAPLGLADRRTVTVSGHLDYRTKNETTPDGLYLRSTVVRTTAPHAPPFDMAERPPADVSIGVNQGVAD